MQRKKYPLSLFQSEYQSLNGFRFFFGRNGPQKRDFFGGGNFFGASPGIWVRGPFDKKKPDIRVRKVLLPSLEIRIFGPKTARFGQKLAFLVILGQILPFFAHFVQCLTKNQCELGA